MPSGCIISSPIPAKGHKALNYKHWSTNLQPPLVRNISQALYCHSLHALHGGKSSSAKVSSLWKTVLSAQMAAVCLCSAALRYVSAGLLGLQPARLMMNSKVAMLRHTIIPCTGQLTPCHYFATTISMKGAGLHRAKCSKKVTARRQFAVLRGTLHMRMPH